MLESKNCNETSDGLVPEFWFCDKSLGTTAVPQISARALTWCGLQYSQVRQLPGPTLWIDERQCLSVSSPILPLDDLSLREHLLLFCWDQHLVAVLKHGQWRPELVRWARLRGATLILAPAYTDTQYGPLWRDAQQNQMFALSFDPPGLILPCEASPDGSGRQNVVLHAPGLWHVQWDWKLLDQAAQSFSILNFLRPDIYRENPWWQIP